MSADINAARVLSTVSAAAVKARKRRRALKLANVAAR